jgi:hypothetical protein
MSDEATVKAFLRAAQRGDVEAVRSASLNGANAPNVNASSASSGNTALHEAAQRESARRGARAACAAAPTSMRATRKAPRRCTKRWRGRAPKRRAFERNGRGCWCAAGADVGAVDRHGDSPLTKAIRQNRRDDLRALARRAARRRALLAPCFTSPRSMRRASIFSTRSLPDSAPPLSTIATPTADRRCSTPVSSATAATFAKLVALCAPIGSSCATPVRASSTTTACRFCSASDISSEFAAFLLEHSCCRARLPRPPPRSRPSARKRKRFRSGRCNALRRRRRATRRRPTPTPMRCLPPLPMRPQIRPI